ncbi:scm-like with four MBT domains protein 1 isoform X1 [Gadus chalcogrammus]|uniref:scm-like with four MBT domains protein 1 isoform X1 n=1 Tax=Gadus chalcogrammus TaxID=1042646 RepID=UPI0024C4E0CA|nr:scm-like with four MBT domains protein 1 isoform X1 [Gadus chalcogrammus]XP_056462789.1 scm-like with four MBT domains protein 1 isoform X1 [Gadus chalcogrammus]XP_056462790.1 scm-like with four MBT domains protein 1 isoform X1 [Gadus chalcogrammus]
MSQEPLESERDSGQDVSDFNWDDYLEESGATSVPHHAFKHVDQGLQTGLAPGMKLEVCVRAEADSPYWVATIITTCGQLLLLRYEGYQDDRRADFWCDIMTADLHPLGWSRQQGKTMRAPEGVREKHQDWQVLLETAIAEEGSAPANLLEMPQRGKDPMELLCAGCYVELQDTSDPGLAWAAEVEENVGGRLKLRPLGTEGLADTPSTLWLYYLHPRLHPPGWAQEHGCTLRPAQDLLALQTAEEWEVVRQRIQELPQDDALDEVFPKDQTPITAHSFKEGMKLEAVDPTAPISISPATVTKVFDELYFLVKMDDLCGMDEGDGGGRSFLRHRESPGIFPVQWSLKNGLPLCPPRGYQGQDFDWADYLKQSEAEAAPQHCFSATLFTSQEPTEHSFKVAMKLEAVNPLSPENIHVATVSKVKGQYIWLNLEGLKQPMPEVVVHVDSMDIFPVSWCETNGYPLVYPIKPPVEKQRKVAVVQPEKHRSQPKSSAPDSERQPTGSQSELGEGCRSIRGQGNGKYCCPKIYFNHRCFSGPYLNKGRIAELPQFIGPGNCVLVLKEVLTLLINSAYKPSRVLRELQLDQEGRWQGHGETLKAKYKGKSYRATVEIVRTSDRVAEFCRKTCIKLECCPNLFGPRMVLDRCSENCSVLTKTKYTYYYGKKKSRRVGRPPGGHSNLEGGAKRRGRRRKRRNGLFVHKKRRSSASLDNTPAGSLQGSGDEEDLDEDESLSEDSGSEVQDELQDDSEYSVGKSLPATPSPSPPATPRPTRRRRKPCSPSFSDDENRPPSPKIAKTEPPQKLCLDTSPLEWSVPDVVRFIRTTDCAPLARIFLDQEIDGQALLLLNLPTVQECMDLKLGPAIKLCHHIERVKLAFYQQFAT